MNSQLSRRKFLKTALISTTALGLTVCGGGALALTYQPKIAMPFENYGEKTMEKRILVTYASKAGSTAEVATRIGKILSNKNLAVDVIPVNKVTDITSYQTVILGSAIRIGNVLPEVQKFVESNQAMLQKKSFHIYFMCMMLEKDTDENRKAVSDYLKPIRALVKPASEGMFAGVINLKKLGLFDQLMIKAMKSPQGDFRDWDQIGSWAERTVAM